MDRSTSDGTNAPLEARTAHHPCHGLPEELADPNFLSLDEHSGATTAENQFAIEPELDGDETTPGNRQ